MSLIAITYSVLGATTLWHALAAYHFLFFPGRTIGRYSHERPVSSVAVALLRFLGGLNAALVALGITAFLIERSSLWAVLLVFGAANLSQVTLDLHAHRLGLVRPPFHRDITLGDGLATALNLAVLGLTWAL